MDLISENVQKLMELGLPLIRAPVASVVFTVLALFAGIMWYCYLPYWGVRKVPGPLALPFLGHLPLLAKYGPDVVSVLAKKYGPIFRFHMGRQPLVVVATADLCREVGIKKFKDIPNRSIPSPIAACPLHQKGLFFSKDGRWAAMRNTILSIYQPSHLAKLIPQMQELIESATQNIQSNEKEIKFSDLSLKLANDVIGKAAFGFDFGLSKPPSPNETTNNVIHDVQNTDEVSEFINEHMYATTALKLDLTGSISVILGLLIPILQEPFRQILMRIPGSLDWKVDRTNESLSGKVDRIVEKRMKENDRSSKDLLSQILNMKDSSNLFSPDYISAVTYEHLLAGSVTTAFTLSTTVYLVADHPEVEKKMIDEIDGFGPRDQMPTAEDLQHKFPYLDQVIKEAMRVYPVSPLIARETSAQVEIGGYILPKGTWVWLAPGVLAQDPKNFPEPDKFRPERFDPNCEEEKQRHPYAYIPFGIGPRMCLGQKFAWQELKLSLIHLYRKYTFRHSISMENPLEFEYGIILSFKHGVKFRAIKRA